ncbi:hypothetical protein BDQ17DRAFT_1393350 [Cyathus striatus]|nr:hypothetical protein BDQ17DRAFT_1393350 [Cyathus striatus]
MIEPPQKRKRTNTMQLKRSSSPPSNRSHLWFDDGSVILQAEATLFKVHRTVLSRHSSVFRDMFSVPQPYDEPTLDGCPLVHLSDSASDIAELLEVLYDKSYNVREAVPFPTLAAMLRLGRKYDFEHLRDEALIRLTSEFPTTLNEWESLAEEFTHIKYQRGILFDVINLAREMSVNSVLPAAYYLCIQDIEEMLNGQIREDGSVAQLPHFLQKASQASSTLAWVDGNSDMCTSCINPMGCSSARALITRKIWKPVPDCSRSLERWSDAPSAGLCKPCMLSARDIHEQGRRRMWELLPSFFGLPPWDELKNCED